MGANRNWQAPPNDNYQEWLLKAIPSEVIGLYLSIHAMLMQLKEPPAVLMWVFMGVCTAVAPLILWKGGIRRVSQYIIGTLAVPVWVMSVPGSGWWTISGWQPVIGGIVVVVYVGAVAPFIAFLATRFGEAQPQN